MPVIIRKLPFFDSPTSVAVAGETVPIKRLQIILWISIGEAGLGSLSPNTRRIPAVFDTGFNHSFVIQRRHLIEWAGIDPRSLVPLDRLQVHGEGARLLAANVWLHPNKPGTRDEFSGRPPYRVELDQGIAVSSGRDELPRLPLLGLRALRWAKLAALIDGRRGQVTVRTARRFWPFR